MITCFLEDSLRRLRRFMRGLLQRILFSCPEHENTGLESVRIIKSPHLFLPTGCIQTIAKEKWTGKIESSHQHDIKQRESNPRQNSKWVGESNPPQTQNGLENPIPRKLLAHTHSHGRALAIFCVIKQRNKSPFEHQQDLR